MRRNWTIAWMAAAWLAIGGLSPSRANAQCMWPRQEPGNNCCACVFGNGYWNCQPSCAGYCVVFSSCNQVKSDIRVGPDGTVYRETPSVVASAAFVAEEASAADLLAISGHWEGLTRHVRRDCRGYVVTRAYSRDAVRAAKREVARIEI